MGRKKNDIFEIEKGIQKAKQGGKNHAEYMKFLNTMLRMKVGESFFVATHDKNACQRVSNKVSYIRRSYSDFDNSYFSTQTEFDASKKIKGVRVFRDK